MAYEFLEKLFGAPTEGEAPKTMTYAELEAAIDADKDIQLANLAAGGYVAQADFDAKVTELAGIKQQLTDANAEINSYKDMDIDGIKQSAADWETKYNTDTKDLKDKLDAQAYEHACDMAATGIKFSSNGARKAFISDLRDKKLTLENGKLLGFDDYVNTYKETDPGAFAPETPPPDDPPAGTPYFSKGTGGSKTTEKPKGSTFGFNFTGVRKHTTD